MLEELITIEFFDFNNYDHSEEWLVKMKSIPRIGERIRFNDRNHKEGLVKEVIWIIADSSKAGEEVILIGVDFDS